MLTEASVVNFKSTEELKRLKLKPLTLFTGINSSGRSNMVEAIAFLGQAASFLEAEPSAQACLMTVFMQGDFEHCPQQIGSFVISEKGRASVSVEMDIRPTMSLGDSARARSQCLVFSLI
jgi:recombinational DNA repair ATPase RecF